MQEDVSDMSQNQAGSHFNFPGLNEFPGLGDESQGTFDLIIVQSLLQECMGQNEQPYDSRVPHDDFFPDV